ncbi:transposase [Streptomyces sp. JNUCC 63]
MELFYLPPRSPELNDIERVWRSAEYEDCPHRAHTGIEAIGTAVDQALTRQRTRIQGSAVNFTKAAQPPHVSLTDRVHRPPGVGRGDLVAVRFPWCPATPHRAPREGAVPDHR